MPVGQGLWVQTRGPAGSLPTAPVPGPRPSLSSFRRVAESLLWLPAREGPRQTPTQAVIAPETRKLY